AQFHANLKSGPQILMIAPASREHSSLRLAYETALMLVQMNEAPVLVMDLESSAANRTDPMEASDAGESFIGTDDLDEGASQRALRRAGLRAFSVIRPLADRQDAAAFLNSPQFAMILEGAKASFTRVLVAADCVLDSMAAAVAASLCDAVVLLVKAD